MEVLFAGICLWDTQDVSPDLLGIMPNAASGATVNGIDIPPHTVAVLAPAGTVDRSQWDEPPTPIEIAGMPYEMFRLRGEDITFDPPPNGGAPSISRIPRALCAQGRQVRRSFVGNTPPANAVAARILLPSNAALATIQNRFGSFVTKVDVASNARLIAQSFSSGQRSLSFNDATTVIVANIDLELAVAGAGRDDDHAHLYCPMFEVALAPAEDVAAEAVRFEPGDDAVVIDGLAFARSAFDESDDGETEAADAEENDEAVDSMSASSATRKRRRPKRRSRRSATAQQLADGMSLGPGCSNSQWP